jgi:hypothetical protein
LFWVHIAKNPEKLNLPTRWKQPLHTVQEQAAAAAASGPEEESEQGYGSVLQSDKA